jgi:hypothetical protein
VQPAVRGAQLVPGGGDALDVPEGLDDVPADLAGFRPAGQRHDAVLDGDLKEFRGPSGGLRDHAVGYFAADLLVWPTEDAEQLGLADDHC